MYEKFTSEQRNNMENLVAYAKELVSKHTNQDTCHHDVCSSICDEFGLWEKVYGKNGFIGEYQIPYWVMYVISGVMNEIGVGGDGNKQW